MEKTCVSRPKRILDIHVRLTLLGIVFFVVFHLRLSLRLVLRQILAMIDARLSGNVLQNTPRFFPPPEQISTGQVWGPDDLAQYLQRVGYRPAADDKLARSVHRSGNTVDVRPRSFLFCREQTVSPCVAGRPIKVHPSIETAEGKLGAADIEPELITNLFDSAREKPPCVRYEDLPPRCQRDLSAEDKRFFEHPGLDFIRIFGAAWNDLRHGTHLQGRQHHHHAGLPRTFFLSTDRNWRRKIAEAMLSFELEQRFQQGKQIFEIVPPMSLSRQSRQLWHSRLCQAVLAISEKDLRPALALRMRLPCGNYSRSQLLSSADRHPEPRRPGQRTACLPQMLDNN